LVHLIYRLNLDPEIHGILVQLPLPDPALEKPALAEIVRDKDVDGLSPISQAQLLAGEPGMRPCTPLGVVELIDKTGVDLTGKRVVIVGLSTPVPGGVGPMTVAMLLRNTLLEPNNLYADRIVASRL